MTHRGLSTSFTVVTGHETGRRRHDIDWEAVARVGRHRRRADGRGHTAPPIAERLDGRRPRRRARRWRPSGGAPGPTSARCAPRWPTCAVRVASRRPCIVIGAVAALDLRWFESRPLFGRRVVVTRARDQASALVGPPPPAGRRAGRGPHHRDRRPRRRRRRAPRRGRRPRRPTTGCASRRPTPSSRFFALPAGRPRLRRRPGSPPSGPAPPPPWPPPASSPTSCPNGRGRGPARRPSRPGHGTGRCCPRPPAPAPCWPGGLRGRGLGGRAWSRPTAPCPVTTVARRGRRAAQGRRHHLHVVLDRRRFLARRPDGVPPRRRLHRAGHRRHRRDAGLAVDVVADRPHHRRPGRRPRPVLLAQVLARAGSSLAESESG